MKNCFYFRISSAKFFYNDSEMITHTPFCDSKVKSQCKVQCSSPIIMDLLTPQTFDGSVLELNQFWIFFLIVSLFWLSQSAIYSLGDSICFDQLGKYFNMCFLYKYYFIVIV